VLTVVYAVKPSDVWAVGHRDGSTLSPVIMHWNGSGWSFETLPTTGPNTYISAITRSPFGTIFAVGATNAGTRTLILKGAP